MTETYNEFKELDGFLAAARHGVDDLPPGLAQRIVTDADQVQAGFGKATAQARTLARTLARAQARTLARTPGPWSQILAVLGGWPTMGGLAAACAAGIWIGLAPPSFLPDPAQIVLWGTSDIDLIGAGDLAMAMSEEG